MNMFPIPTANEIMGEQRRVKSLAETNAKKKFAKNKWRRLCSINKCEKQAQRKGLCARHLTENKSRQRATKIIAISSHSSENSPADGSGTISNNAILLATFFRKTYRLNIWHTYSEFLCFTSTMNGRTPYLYYQF
jgi:hypothetical protein